MPEETKEVPDLALEKAACCDEQDISGREERELSRRPRVPETNLQFAQQFPPGGDPRD